MIIRVKEEPEVDDKRYSGADGGSNTKENSGKTASKRADELKKGGLSHSRKRKLSQKRKSMEERESKVSSFEVLQPTMNPVLSKPGQMTGNQWATSQQNYPALVQHLYHQLYQMQQQLQAQSHHPRHSNNMPPPPPPMGQATGEPYHPLSGQYLSFQQLQLAKGKDRSAMLVPIHGNVQLKNPGNVPGATKSKRTPGGGRGRRAKNGEGRLTKKVCIVIT